MFAVQIKSSKITNEKSIPKLVKLDNRSGLDQFEIKYPSQLNIKRDENTIQYWKGLGIPVYLFFVHEDKNKEISCYYRRYTPFITDPKPAWDDAGEYYQEFYKVNNGYSFLAFSNQEKRLGGFARHLFIDSVRCNYANGVIMGLYDTLNMVGLKDFDDFVGVYDLIEKHEDRIRKAYEETGRILESFEERKAEKKKRINLQ